MKIGIIGGSIAGCVLAVLLKDKFEITVFEKTQELNSRGAGLTISTDLLEKLIEKNIFNADIDVFKIPTRSFYCKSPMQPDYGKYLWRQNLSIVTLHWDTLFSNLRKHIPNEIYRKNSPVIGVQLKEDGPGLITLESGEVQEFDLIVFADGYQSMGRSIISASSQSAYAGYVAWRGVIDFELIENKMPFIDNIPYYCFDKGHLIAYPVHHENRKKINWVLYEKLSFEEVCDLGSTSQADFSVNAKEHLHHFARLKLPNSIAQMVIKTKLPFMQKIVDVSLEKLVAKNALLHGDASVVLRPHVGNGALLAIQDALLLEEKLNQYDNLYQAIAEWENEVLPKRLATYDLSKRMADALVLKPVLWQGMNSDLMDSWWDQIMLGEQWYTSNNQQIVSDVPDSSLVFK